MVGWQVARKPVRTRDGRRMMFLTLEDTTALYETILFPAACARFGGLLHSEGPFLVEGFLRREQGVVTLEIQDLRMLEEAP